MKDTTITFIILVFTLLSFTVSLLKIIDGERHIMWPLFVAIMASMAIGCIIDLAKKWNN